MPVSSIWLVKVLVCRGRLAVKRPPCEGNLHTPESDDDQRSVTSSVFGPDAAIHLAFGRWPENSGAPWRSHLSATRRKSFPPLESERRCGVHQPRHGYVAEGAALAGNVVKQELKIGDTVVVVGYRPGKYPAGVKDELGTEKLFKSLVGRQLKIKGFDQYGHVELRPTRKDTVWIEPDLTKLFSADDQNLKGKKK